MSIAGPSRIPSIHLCHNNASQELSSARQLQLVISFFPSTLAFFALSCPLHAPLWRCGCRDGSIERKEMLGVLFPKTMAKGLAERTDSAISCNWRSASIWTIAASRPEDMSYDTHATRKSPKLLKGSISFNFKLKDKLKERKA